MKSKFNRRRFILLTLLGWALLWPGLADTGWRTGAELRLVAKSPIQGGPIQPLVADRSLGVSFIAPEDNLAAIDIRVATYQRINPSRLVMLLYRLRDDKLRIPDPAERVAIRRVVTGTAGFQDWGTARLEFEPIEDSGGDRFYAVFLSPGARIFECIGMITGPGPKTGDWRGYENGKPAVNLPAVNLLSADARPSPLTGWWWLLAVVPILAWVPARMGGE